MVIKSTIIMVEKFHGDISEINFYMLILIMFDVII